MRSTQSTASTLGSRGSPCCAIHCSTRIVARKGQDESGYCHPFAEKASILLSRAITLSNSLIMRHNLKSKQSRRTERVARSFTLLRSAQYKDQARPGAYGNSAIADAGAELNRLSARETASHSS